MVFPLRSHLFDLLDYINRRSEKLGFQKKKKKKNFFLNPAVRSIHSGLVECNT